MVCLAHVEVMKQAVNRKKRGFHVERYSQILSDACSTCAVRKARRSPTSGIHGIKSTRVAHRVLIAGSMVLLQNWFRLYLRVSSGRFASYSPYEVDPQIPKRSMADSSSLPAPDITHEQPSISTHPTPDEKEATPTPAINDDDTVPNSPSGASEWPAYIRGRKRKWSALGIEQKHMDDLEGIALG